MIELINVSRVYGQGDAAVHALREVSLEVADGAFVTVVGTSGSGKTTLLNVIGGLDTEISGEVRVAGRALNSLTDRELSLFRNETVGFVFQHFHLLDHLSARQNVLLPMFFGDRPLNEADAVQALARVGLKDKLDAYPSQLSGGQKQRVAIARALFSRPRLILCDEPTGNLDTVTSRQIIGLFESLNHEDGITVVVVTHEESLFANATRQVRIEDGRLVESSLVAGGAR